MQINTWQITIFVVLCLGKFLFRSTLRIIPCLFTRPRYNLEKPLRFLLLYFKCKFFLVDYNNIFFSFGFHSWSAKGTVYMFVYKWCQIWWAWKQVALILIICLILSFLIYQLLTISADSLTWMMRLYVIPPHKALFVFSSEFDCIFWFLLEQLRTSVVLPFHSYSPMSPCVSAMFSLAESNIVKVY